MRTPASHRSDPRRELDSRVSGGMEVTLWWNPLDDRTSVEVRHFDSSEVVTFEVPPEQALEAFHHPFAHLAMAAGDPIAAL
jgi:hypothetical protein